MALSRQRTDREHDKFTLTSTNETAVRVVNYAQPLTEQDQLNEINIYNEASSVAQNSIATLINYTATSICKINEIAISANNVSHFQVYINDVKCAESRLWHMNFNDVISLYRILKINDNLKVTATSHRPTPSDYSVRVNGVKNG